MNITININFGKEESEQIQCSLTDILKGLSQLINQEPVKKAEKVAIDAKTVKPPVAKTARKVHRRHHKRKGNFGKQKSLSLDHDSVALLVSEYDTVIRAGDTGSVAIKKACKNLGLTCSEYVARRALFQHKDIPGYEDIPVPTKTFTRVSTEDPQTRSIVEEIKFLRDRKNADLTTIIRLTKQDALWTRKVYDGYTFSDINLTRENILVFEEKYRDLPERQRPMKLD